MRRMFRGFILRDRLLAEGLTQKCLSRMDGFTERRLWRRLHRS